MTKRQTSEQLEKLKAFGSATIHEAQGQKGAFESSMKLLDPTLRLVGRALTVELRPDDNLLIHYAVALAEPGDVLVVDAKGFLEAGPWGDILTLAAQQRGIAGLVITRCGARCRKHHRDELPHFLPRIIDQGHGEGTERQGECAASHEWRRYQPRRCRRWRQGWVGGGGPLRKWRMPLQPANGAG